MIIDLDSIVLIEQVLDLREIIIRADTTLRSTEVVDARRNPHVGQRQGRLDWMMNELEERRLGLCWEGVVQPRRRIAQPL